jgi:hypothetical protein
MEKKGIMIMTEKGFRKQQEFLRTLDNLLMVYRAYGFDHVEMLRYILKKLGYEMHISKTGLIRLKRNWIIKDKEVMIK